MIRSRRAAVVAALALLGALALGAAAPAVAAPGAPADPPGCTPQGPDGKCVVDNDDDGPGGPGGGGGGGGGDPWSCMWSGPIDPAVGRAAWPEAPESAGYWLFEDCGSGGGNGRHDAWERVGYAEGSWMNFVVIGQPIDIPSPTEVATDLWSQVVGNLPAPDPIVSPPTGRAAIVDHPTFVAVGNWTSVRETDCDDVLGIVCVTLVAEPRLSFDPGDGSDVVECAGSGTVFDPAHDPDGQADAAGACAHRYARRTGAEGRPAAWAGEVTVTWDVSWSASNPDGSGTLPDFSLSTELSRRVDEVHGIVVDAEEGLG